MRNVRPRRPGAILAVILIAIQWAAGCDRGSPGASGPGGTSPSGVLVTYWDAVLAADLDTVLAVSDASLSRGLIGDDKSGYLQAEREIGGLSFVFRDDFGVDGIEIVGETVDGDLATVVFRYRFRDGRPGPDVPPTMGMTHERMLRRYADRWLVLPE